MLPFLFTDAQICSGDSPALVFSYPFSALYSPLLIFDWQYHPDKQSTDVPAGTVEECLQKFIEVDQAWKVLGNEETKTQYDLQRRGRYLAPGLRP